MYLINNDYNTALSKYKEVLKLNPENPEVSVNIGMLYLKQSQVDNAYFYLKETLKYYPNHTNALLALGSINQDKGDLEGALTNYRLSSKVSCNYSLLWNNLGLCFLSKKKYITAIACLKKALYLDPLQWIINFNLGLVYILTGQFSSAYIHMNAVANLKSSLSIVFMYLGLILSRLTDVQSSIEFYEKSLNLEENYLTSFNYVVSLINNEMLGNARVKYSDFVKIFNNDSKEDIYKEDVINASKTIKDILKKIK